MSEQNQNRMIDKNRTLEKGAEVQKPKSDLRMTAYLIDRDKNICYWATDESVDEILDEDGYHVVHANRNLKNGN